jgi:Ca2+/H+ antiporter, TMEM165/GDT1 family
VTDADIGAALRAFAAVFPAELPDKTMIATVVLVAHHRRALPVWCGAAAAFTLHVALAVTAGRALRLLPATPVALVTAALFAVGAVLLWRETGSDDDDQPDMPAVPPASTWRAAFLGSFGVVMVAEAGDLTQLATAGIAASSDAPLSVAVGALAALWLVAALAASLGRRLVAWLPVRHLRRAAAVVFATLAVVTLVATAT